MSNATPTKDIRRSFSAFAADLVELVELQVQLLLVDLRDSQRQVVVPLLLIVLGVVATVGAIPVMLVGCSWLLAGFSGLSVAAACVILGGGTMVLSAVVILRSLHGLQEVIQILARSKAELLSNARWLKDSLKKRCD